MSFLVKGAGRSHWSHRKTRLAAKFKTAQPSHLSEIVHFVPRHGVRGSLLHLADLSMHALRSSQVVTNMKARRLLTDQLVFHRTNAP